MVETNENLHITFQIAARNAVLIQEAYSSCCFEFIHQLENV